MSILLVVYVSNKRFSFKLFADVCSPPSPSPPYQHRVPRIIHAHSSSSHEPCSIVNFITFLSVIRDRAIPRRMKLNRVNASPVSDMPARHTTRSCLEIIDIRGGRLPVSHIGGRLSDEQESTRGDPYATCLPFPYRNTIRGKTEWKRGRTSLVRL